MKKFNPDEPLRCSFCHKTQEQVEKLISSPSDYPRAYICNECVSVCQTILEDEKREQAAAPARRLPRPPEIKQFLDVHDLVMMVNKSLCFGLIVSVVCCKKGFFASGGARGVGEATAKAVVSSIVAIFAFDYVLTTLMTEL